MPITIRKFLIGSEQLDSDSVYGAKIADDAVGSEHLANNAVSYAAQIKDGIVGYAELTAGVQGSISAGSVPGANSIGTTQLKDPSVDTAELYDDAVGTSSKIAADVVMGYHIVDDAIGSEHLEADAVGSSAQVGDNVIHDEHLADDAVGSSADIAADVVMGYHIVDDAIGSEHLEADAVGSSAQVGDNVIHDEHIVDDAIGSEHLETDAVGSSIQVGDDVIGHDQMMDNAIGYTELTTGLQGSLAVSASERPYAGDYSEMSNLGTAPGTIKTAAILKNAYALPIGSIKIGVTLKCSAGSYTMRVRFDGSSLLSFTGTLTSYKTHVGSFGVGGYADGVHNLYFVLENSDTSATSYNQLADIIVVL